MEVAGGQYQLVRIRLIGSNLMQLLYDTETRGYYYQHHRNGSKIGFEYAGCEESTAIIGFEGWVQECTE
jgi:hypothetical protein